MITLLKLICNYKEFCNDKSLPSAKDNVFALPSADKKKVLQYLKNGTAGFASTAKFDDAMTGEQVNQEFCTFNDGEYGWSTQEIYHFEKYDIKLDDGFLKKILN